MKIGAEEAIALLGRRIQGKNSKRACGVLVTSGDVGKRGSEKNDRKAEATVAGWQVVQGRQEN